MGARILTLRRDLRENLKAMSCAVKMDKRSVRTEMRREKHLLISRVSEDASVYDEVHEYVRLMEC